MDDNMADQIFYRNAIEDDLYSIAKVHVSSWKSAYRDIVPDDYLDDLSIEKRHKVWAEKIFPYLQDTKQCLFVAELDKKIIGFASAGAAREVVLPYKGELYAIYLDPEYYGQGVGKPLFKMCVEHLKKHNMHDMYLWVLKDNNLGIAFYKKMGGHHVIDYDKLITINGIELPEILYGWSLLDV